MGQSSAHTHYNQVLTNFAVAFNPPELAAQRVCIPVKVAKESDVWSVSDKSGYNTVNDIRADGTPENETDMGWKYQAYLVEGHGLKTKITKRMRENADSQTGLEENKTRNVKQKVLNTLESRILGSTGILRTVANNAGSTNISLATIATATPRSHFSTAQLGIWAASGKMPNTAVVAVNVAKRIVECAEYKDEHRYVADLRGDDFEIPAGTYGIDNWIIVKSLVNTARKGVAQSLACPMSDDIWVGYIDPNPGTEVQTHNVLLYTEEYMRKWWDDDIEADWIAYNYNYVPVLVDPNCGWLLTSALT